jgi:hypothetical protein
MGPANATVNSIDWAAAGKEDAIMIGQIEHQRIRIVS